MISHPSRQSPAKREKRHNAFGLFVGINRCAPFLFMHAFGTSEIKQLPLVVVVVVETLSSSK